MTTGSKIKVITEVNIKYSEDITFLLKLFRLYAGKASLSTKQISRLATALNEISRNALQYAGEAKISFGIYEEPTQNYFAIQIADNGKGISNLEDILAEKVEGSGVGIIVSRKLVNKFDIKTSLNGTNVFLAEKLNHAKNILADDINEWKDDVSSEKNEDNSLNELLHAYETIREKENQLEISNRKLKNYVTQLKSKNSELKNFARVVSHDLKSPLNVVFMASEMLNSFYIEDMGEEATEMLDMIITASNNMKQLINDYLNYAAATAQEDKPEHIDLNAIVFDVEDSVNSPEQKEVQINFGELPNIYYDRFAIKQILQNLIDNAVTYNDKDEVKITVSAEKNKTHTIIKVEDNGPGIPESHFTDIFELYRTVGLKGVAKKGTGVGLPLIKRIVERNHGKVWLDSTLNEGSSFYFSVPNESESVFENA